MDDINGYLLTYKPFTQDVTSTIRLLGWALLGSINILFETICKNHVLHLRFPHYIIGSIKFDRKNMIKDMCGNWSDSRILLIL